METIKIDLNLYKSEKSSIFTGRPQGKAVRDKLNLDKFDKDNNTKVVFMIPDNTSSFNPSFYLGLLFPSYETLGVEKFDTKYSFEILTENEEVTRVINSDLLDGKRSAINSMKNSSSIFGKFFK
jgi:hypothetical protein